MKLWTFAALVLLVAVLAVAPAQSQGDLTVVLETAPPAGQIGPDKTLVRTILRVVDAGGQAIPHAYLKLHLDAPPGNPLISTDFPIVEDTPLLEYEGVLSAGTLEFDYIYPIRGQYSFQVEAGRDAAAPGFKDTLYLSLNENPNEVINGLVFIGLLLGLGLVAGVIIGNGARAQRLAVGGVVLAGLVAGLLIATPPARAHGGGDSSPVKPFSDSASNGDLTLTYQMNPGAGRVGTLNMLSFQATASSGALAPDTTFEVNLWHIEDQKPVFSSRFFAPGGQTGFKFQFFDGAAHEVRVTARNAQGTAGLARVVEVEGIDPPLPVKIKTTVYLTLVALGGALMGLRLPSIRRRKREFSSVGVR